MTTNDSLSIPQTGNALLRHRWALTLLSVYTLALVLRLLLIAAWYSEDLGRFESGDYPLYAIGAEHFEEHRDFSNSLFLVRPPLFSLIIYLLDRSDLAVLVVNSLVGALIAPLTCVLGQRLGLSDSGALIAGALVAIDPAGIVYSAFLGPEPFANLFLLAAILSLLMAIWGGKGTARWGIAAGVFLVLSAYTRPATYLLWPVLAVWLLAVNRKKWVAVAAFVLVSVVGVGSWIVHNGRVFNYYTFSTIGPYTLVYYHAASVEHLATGHDMNTVYTTINRRVEERLGHDDTTEVDEGWRHRYLAATPEIADALNSVAVEIFTDHPLIFLLTFPVGFSRMFGLTTTALADSSLAVAGVEVGWNAVFVVGTLAGLWLAFRRRQWLLFWCVLLIIGYFTTGTLIMKSAGMTTRERSVLAPFMAVAAAYTITVLIERRQVNREPHLGEPDRVLVNHP